jgi:hypothetical protein
MCRNNGREYSFVYNSDKKYYTDIRTCLAVGTSPESVKNERHVCVRNVTHAIIKFN